MKVKILVVFFISLFLLFGCIPGINDSKEVLTDTSTAQPPMTSTYDTTVEAALATVNALSTSDLQKKLDDQATSIVSSLSTQQALNLTVTVTQTTGVGSFTTEDPLRATTEQSTINQNVINRLFDNGFINSDEGELYRLDDFISNGKEFEAMETDFSANNFVLSAKIFMETTGDPGVEGCGLIIGKLNNYLAMFASGNIKYYVSYITRRGLGYWQTTDVLDKSRFGGGKPIKNFVIIIPDLYYYEGNWTNNYNKNHEFEFMLINSNKLATVFVNEEQKFQAENNQYSYGEINLFSTENSICRMTNIELWIYDKD